MKEKLPPTSNNFILKISALFSYILFESPIKILEASSLAMAVVPPIILDSSALFVESKLELNKLKIIPPNEFFGLYEKDYFEMLENMIYDEKISFNELISKILSKHPAGNKVP